MSAELVKQMRQLRGLQIHVAALCGVSKAAVNQWKSVPERHRLVVERAVKRFQRRVKR